MARNEKPSRISNKVVRTCFKSWAGIGYVTSVITGAEPCRDWNQVLPRYKSRASLLHRLTQSHDQRFKRRFANKIRRQSKETVTKTDKFYDKDIEEHRYNIIRQ